MFGIAVIVFYREIGGRIGLEECLTHKTSTVPVSVKQTIPMLSISSGDDYCSSFFETLTR